MTIADTIVYGSIAAMDWLYEHVFAGREWLLLVAMLLAFFYAGSNE